MQLYTTSNDDSTKTIEKDRAHNYLMCNPPVALSIINITLDADLVPLPQPNPTCILPII